MMVDRKECPMRTDLGNCMPIGGFCFNAVSDEICEAVHSAYNQGFVDCLIKHYMIEKEKAFVLDIKDIHHRKEFCEFRWGIPAGYEPINAILRWLNNPKYIYGKTWRCWSKRPSEELMKNTPWS